MKWTSALAIYLLFWAFSAFWPLLYGLCERLGWSRRLDRAGL